MVVGLGSSLGDRRTTMRRAVWLLTQRGVVVEAASPVYQTPALPLPDPAAWEGPLPDFYNAAVRAVLPGYGLERLLAHVREIEQHLGRERPDRVRWGPRTIDLDLLWADGSPHRTEELEVPHPRLRERTFALRPLLEVMPEATDPRNGRRYADLPQARVEMRPRFLQL